MKALPTSHWRAGALMLALAAMACGHRGANTGAVPPALLPPAPPVATENYRIQRGDELDVKFIFQPDESQHVVVRPDGRIGLPATGELEAVGMTPAELERLVAEHAAAHLRNPQVTVIVTHLGEERVYVGGEVLRPGYVTLRPDMTPLQAVIQSGGFKLTAKLESVLLLTPDPQGKFTAARVDMKQVVKEGVPERVHLHPDDVLFVPTTWIADMDNTVDQYVRGLIPALPRVGVGYSLSQ